MNLKDLLEYAEVGATEMIKSCPAETRLGGMVSNDLEHIRIFMVHADRGGLSISGAKVPCDCRIIPVTN